MLFATSLNEFLYTDHFNDECLTKYMFHKSSLLFLLQDRNGTIKFKRWINKIAKLNLELVNILLPIYLLGLIVQSKRYNNQSLLFNLSSVT